MNKQLISVNRLKIIDNDKGKVMKGPNYFKPDLNKFIKK